MAIRIDEIIETLERSEALYQLLVPLMQREKGAALGANPRILAEVTADKEALLSQLNALERQRTRLVDLAAEETKIPVTGLNLSALADLAGDDQKIRITRLQGTLARLVQTVKRQNDENRALIQHCLDLTHSAIGFFQHWTIPASVYGASGHIRSGRPNGKLLSGNV
jgi:flagellar biosynthesis/type III secretory pathway chaperone